MQIKKWKTTCPLYTYATIHQRYTIPTNGSSIKKNTQKFTAKPAHLPSTLYNNQTLQK